MYQHEKITTYINLLQHL